MKVRFSGLTEFTEFIKRLPRGMKIAGMRAVAEYIMGDEKHGLSHYPARVNHDAGNPYQWQSEKQRKAYFATNGFGGGIPYQRTNEMQGGWYVHESNSDWSRVNVQNKMPYAQYVMGDRQQRGHIADKWRHFAQVVSDNMAGAIRHAQAEVGKLIARRGK